MLEEEEVETYPEALDPTAADILTFWFGLRFWKRNGLRSADRGYFDDLWQLKWFAKGDLTNKMDSQLQSQFLSHLEKAERGEYDNWGSNSNGTLSLIILLDQFSRNIYRNTAKAWSNDSKALKLCLNGVDKGHDKMLPPIARLQFYMPLVHAEDFDVQQRLSLLAQELLMLKDRATEEILLRFKVICDRHLHVISVFGRFPERNIYLGRHSTPAEESYLTA